MDSWGVFLIIALVLGFIVSNLLLLKQSAKFKLPESVKKAIEEKKRSADEKKPTDK